MINREKDLVKAYLAGKISRRGLLKSLAAMGVGTAAGGSLMGAMSSGN